MEQEGQPARSRRSEWIAEKIAKLKPRTILEIGCGYGKQLRQIRMRTDAAIVGVDFSPTQLGLARKYLADCEGMDLALAQGDQLPFPDRCFDVVLTSAVILHNPPEQAERIRSELLRVCARHAVHNEDLGVSYNRYGYNTVQWYRDRGIEIVEASPFPPDCVSEPDEQSQFCVALPWP